MVPKLSLMMLIAAGLFWGCNTKTPTDPGNDLQSLMTVTPADGATSVDRNVGIGLSFVIAPERLLVTSGVHLISSYALDSLHGMGMMGHMTMTDAMADSAVMRYLDEYHSTPGKITWSDDDRQCVFQPDSTLTPNTEYMIHFDQTMISMMDQRADSMGMMMQFGQGTGNGTMVHFTTGN